MRPSKIQKLFIKQPETNLARKTFFHKLYKYYFMSEEKKDGQ